jgi:succinate dehydrogenase / fumarate reductase cytochrome b subunit
MADCTVSRFLRSTIGLKVLMGLTGLILFGFLIGHVAGNLLAFAGEEKLNEYSRWLREHPGLLWGARGVLLVSVGVHILTTITLVRLKGEARPIPYAAKEPHGTTYAARTMTWSGPFIALFVVYHLLHFTFGVHLVHPTFQHGNVYHNVVAGFTLVPVTVYTLALVLLGLHLAHGLWSVLQTLGINRPNWEPALRKLAMVVAVLIIGGFLSIPFGVIFGMIR